MVMVGGRRVAHCGDAVPAGGAVKLRVVVQVHPELLRGTGVQMLLEEIYLQNTRTRTQRF